MANFAHNFTQTSVCGLGFNFVSQCSLYEVYFPPGENLGGNTAGTSIENKHKCHNQVLTSRHQTVSREQRLVGITASIHILGPWPCLDINCTTDKEVDLAQLLPDLLPCNVVVASLIVR